MATGNTLFDSMLSDHFGSVTRIPDYTYEAVIKAGAYQFKAIRVLAYTNRQHYVKNLFEEILVTVAVLPSEYTELLVRGHDQLQVWISKVTNTGIRSATTSYRAVLAANKDHRLENNDQATANAGEHDANSFVTVTMQLLDPATYYLRLQQIGGVFRDTTSINVLRYCLSLLKLDDKFSNNDSVAAIEVQPGWLTDTYSSIVIPDGSTIGKVANLLQDHYGVYNQGLGVFLHSRVWHIFPPYAIQRTNANTRKLVILNAPPYRFRGAEHNLKVTGNTIYIAATGDVSHIKHSDKQALDLGNGVRYADTKSLLNNSLDLSKSPTSNAANYMTEYSVSDYKGPYTNAPLVGYSDNPAKHMSDLAARNGDMITVVWERGQIDLLEPGMPVIFITPDGAGVRQLAGTLIAAESHASSPTPGLVDVVLKNVVSLSLFLKSVK